MAMTEVEKKAAYLQWINAETGQNYQLEDLPALVELVLDKLLEMDGDKANIKAMTQGGRSVTFTDGVGDKIKELLAPLRKLRW